MIELGQLEAQQAEFARRNTRVVVASVESQQDAAKTAADFPHLLVLADEGRGLSEAVNLIHQRQGPGGADADAPTTILVDRRGTVRWLYRSPEVISRLSPDDVLRAVDEHLPPGP